MKVAGITANYMPAIEKKVIITMAADHGIAVEGVSAYPREVTAQMVYNFLRGGAAINVHARHIGARVVVVDMGVAADIDIGEGEDSGNDNYIFVKKKIGYGTANISKGGAMS